MLFAAEAAWPSFDPGAAAEQEVTLVVQVSGKVRDRVPVPIGLDQKTATEKALASPAVRRALELDREPGRVRDWYGRHLFGQATLMARRT